MERYQQEDNKTPAHAIPSQSTGPEREARQKEKSKKKTNDFEQHTVKSEKLRYENADELYE